MSPTGRQRVDKLLTAVFSLLTQEKYHREKSS